MSIDQDALFPIRTVSELTGVNAITLRAWERRYGLIQPHRTEKGHRLYSMKDVDFINKVLDVLKKGVSIGRVRYLLGTSKEPLKLPDADNMEADESANVDIPKMAFLHGADGELWKDYTDKLQQCLTTFDISSLDRVYHELTSQYPLNLVASHVLLPLLQQSAEKSKHLVSIAGEYHFFLQYLLSRITASYLKDNVENAHKKHSRRLLSVCFGHETGEVYLRLLGAGLITQGYHMIFLGHLSGADALPMALERSSAQGLLVHQAELSSLNIDHLSCLIDTVNVPVFFNGKGVDESLEKPLQPTGAVVLPEEMKAAMDLINQHYFKSD